ncbi:MAG: MFS transporter [Blastocatellia bacterium]|nr:MFS transporter [Blastocatellia bacterium]MBL8195169.1 MFS transporter [Blastocatellia bacterium]MBN8723174.1 MFS transporter [Acidobacteriota bacterium]
MQKNSSTPSPASSSKPISAAYSYYALVIFSLLNLLNYVDRFIFSALIPNIKADMHFTDAQIGYMGSAFTIVYTIFSPLYGYLADRRARTSLISSGVAIWSIATAAAGLAQNYWQMLIARAAVGIGEASYATISPGFLSDYFDRSKRGIAFGIFFTAVPLGQALGYILAGKLSPPDVLGWRYTFFVVGIPGLLMALAAHFLREPERGKLDQVEQEKPLEKTDSNSSSPANDSLLSSYKILIKTYPYIIATLGYSALTFALGSLSYWGLELLVSNKGIEKEIASVKLGLYVTFGGLLGTLMGGWIGDKLLKWFKGGYFLVCAFSALLSSIPLTIVLSSSNPDTIFTAIFITVFLFFLGNGPVNAIVVNSVPPHVRATAVATTILSIHVLGDAISQPLVGIISTWITKQGYVPAFITPVTNLLGLGANQSLAIAMLITPIALAISGLLFFLGLVDRENFKKNHDF